MMESGVQTSIEGAQNGDLKDRLAWNCLQHQLPHRRLITSSVLLARTSGRRRAQWDPEPQGPW